MIPKARIFEVADILRAKFLADHLVFEYMDDPTPLHKFSTQVVIQIFDLNHGKVFFRLVDLYISSQIPFIRFEASEIGARELYYDNRVDSLSRLEEAFCNKIDSMIFTKRYVLVPIISYQIWRNHVSDSKIAE